MQSHNIALDHPKYIEKEQRKQGLDLKGGILKGLKARGLVCIREPIL
jgi:hypothetical protein